MAAAAMCVAAPPADAGTLLSSSGGGRVPRRGWTVYGCADLRHMRPPGALSSERTLGEAAGAGHWWQPWLRARNRPPLPRCC